MSIPQVFVVRDRELLLEAVSARLVTLLVDRVAAAGTARLLLAEDPLVDEFLTTLAGGRVHHAVEWSRIDAWWANASWARSRGGQPTTSTAAATLTSLGVPADGIHPILRDGEPSDPDRSATEYANALAAARFFGDHGRVPAFVVAILTVGADGSIAGLHPEHPSAYDERAVTVDRTTSQISLTSTALNTADQVWLLGSGSHQAAGIHLAVAESGPTQVPAAGVRGTSRTCVLVDEAAAARLPQAMRRLASP
ncbi:MAG: 6-phosphogluconolactonase [Candidatus Nanopelagicales bacterium]